MAILRRVNHPNIILLVEEFDTKDSLYLVMEYVKVKSRRDKNKGSLGVLFIEGNYDGNINQVTMEK